MSATNHTSNYNLPIYEAGNTANWLVDFNGAMSTIDQSMNENKLAGDTLKTDMEELQTDFQQVSTKADAAEQAATQASTNAANALTIANNATTIAGDAQVDAHAALTQIEKLTVINSSPTIIVNTATIIGNSPVGYIHLFDTSSNIGYSLNGEIIFSSDPSKMPTNDWKLVPGQTLMYYSPSYVYSEMPLIDTQSSLGLYSLGNNAIWECDIAEDWVTTAEKYKPNVIALGIYINDNKAYIAIQFTPNVRRIRRFAGKSYTPRRPRLLNPLKLINPFENNDSYAKTAGTFIELDNID